MHLIFRVDEVAKLICRSLWDLGAKGSVLSLACTCRTLEEPALCTIWEDEEGIAIVTVLKTLPQSTWSEEGGFAFIGTPPTNQEWKRCRRYSSRVRYLDLLYLPELDQHTIGILLDAMATIPMWPRLKVVFCMVPKTTCLLPYVVGPNTSSIYLQFGNTSDEDVLWGADVPEAITALSMIEDRSGSLVNLALLEVQVVNGGFCGALRRLILKNVGSLTKITLATVDSVSVPVTQDIFLLPHLQYLIMRLPILSGPLPGIPPSLKCLEIVVDNEETLTHVFTACRNSQLILLAISYTPLSSPGNWENLASILASGQLTQTLTEFFWGDPMPPHELDPGMLKAFLPFTNLQVLRIDTSCETPWCEFTFDHTDVCELSSALPNLRILHLGGDPCGRSTTTVSFETLGAISKHCKHLESLRIHFNPNDINTLSRSEEVYVALEDSGVKTHSECALKTLNVGKIRLPGEKGLLDWLVALALLEIFPSLSVIEHDRSSILWPEVERRIRSCKVVKKFAGYARA